MNIIVFEFRSQHIWRFTSSNQLNQRKWVLLFMYTLLEGILPTISISRSRCCEVRSLMKQIILNWKWICFIKWLDHDKQHEYLHIASGENIISETFCSINIFNWIEFPPGKQACARGKNSFKWWCSYMYV